MVFHKHRTGYCQLRGEYSTLLETGYFLQIGVLLRLLNYEVKDTQLGSRTLAIEIVVCVRVCFSYYLYVLYRNFVIS